MPDLRFYPCFSKQLFMMSLLIWEKSHVLTVYSKSMPSMIWQMELTFSCCFLYFFRRFYQRVAPLNTAYITGWEMKPRKLASVFSLPIYMYFWHYYLMFQIKDYSIMMIYLQLNLIHGK